MLMVNFLKYYVPNVLHLILVYQKIVRKRISASFKKELKLDACLVT